MSAPVEIIVEEIDKVVEVPAAAVFTRGTDDYVYVVDEGVARCQGRDSSRGIRQAPGAVGAQDRRPDRSL